MKSRDARLLGKEFRKIQPKLRMFAKAKDKVNERRSEFAASIRMADIPKSVYEEDVIAAAPVRVCGTVAKRQLQTKKMNDVSNKVLANAFIWRHSSKPKHKNEVEKLSTKTITLNELKTLTDDEDIAYIELGEALKHPDAEITTRGVKAPVRGVRNIPVRDEGGKDILIGIIDVGGFDFSHDDFLKNGETRWVRIWDQKGDPTKGGRNHPKDFDYGSEITDTHMNKAIASASNVGVPAWALEPQTQQTLGSHGTHVASIAAGNRGVCRNAAIAGVLIDIPSKFFIEHKHSFYDSTRVADAVKYLCDLQAELGYEALSINISLGTNSGGHDASNGASRYIDHLLATPGRAVSVAAGNAGQEAASNPDDYGFIMGRIHTSGKVEARGLTTDIDWVVVGNGIADVSENELEIWYSGADRFAVSITPPGLPTIGPIEPGKYYQNQKLPDGSMLSIYNEVYHPANGSNYISIYLSPFLKENPIVGVRPGKWRVRLHGIEVRDGHYHGWIERDDPRKRGIQGDRDLWNFPSFFTEDSNVDNSSVSSLACGHRVVSVANLNDASEKINISSSQGPTRDGRFKPDVAAPGTKIIAANGFADEEDGLWIEMTGTSMASPYVCGVIGLMQEVEPSLTSAQICGIIQKTSNPLPGSNYAWSNDAGFGVLNPTACVEEAKLLNLRERLEIK